MSSSNDDNYIRMVSINNAILAAIILIFFAGWAYFEFGGAKEVPVDKEELALEIRARLAEHSSEIEAEAKSVAAEVIPPLSEAFYAEARNDSPRYLNTMQAEGEKFAEHAEKFFIAGVRAEYDDYLQRHRQVLAEEFPDHADKESIDRLLAEFKKTGNQLIDRYYVTEFAEEAKRTQVAWNKFEPLDKPGPDEPPFEEQFAEYAADWSVLAFSDRARDAVLSD